jgi:hypothetical protein
MPGAAQPAIAGGINPASKRPVAMPATPWLASDGADQQISEYK